MIRCNPVYWLCLGIYIGCLTMRLVYNLSGWSFFVFLIVIAIVLIINDYIKSNYE